MGAGLSLQWIGGPHLAIATRHDTAAASRPGVVKGLHRSVRRSNPVIPALASHDGNAPVRGYRAPPDALYNLHSNP